MTRDYGIITVDKRKDEVLKYVRNHSSCDFEDIINHLTNSGIGSRVTIRSAVFELLKEGKLDDGKVRKNSKSYKFTVVEDNPLLTIPTDLELITSKFERFLSVIRKLKSETRKIHYRIHYKEDNPSISERIDPEEIVKTISYLPYYVINEIDKIYKFNMLIILPTRIHRESVLNNLYSLYFEYLTKLYLMASGETKKTRPSVTDLSIEETHLFKAYKKSNVGFTTQMFWTCRVLNIESELYDVLDQVWLRNIEVCPFLYGLQWRSKLMTHQHALENFSPKYNDLVKNNETLKEMHLMMDSDIFEYEEIYFQGDDPRIDDDLYNYYTD